MGESHATPRAVSVARVRRAERAHDVENVVRASEECRCTGCPTARPVGFPLSRRRVAEASSGERKGAAEGESSDGDLFQDATMVSLQHSIGVLVQYSMVTAGVEGGWHSVHPVVHAWCLHNITTTVAKRKLFATALRLVSAMAQGFSRSVTREAGFRLIAHAGAVGRRAGVSLEIEIPAGHYRSIADFLQDWECSDEVESLYLQALSRYNEALGEKHTSTLDTVNNLGSLYANQGKVVEVKEMFLVRSKVIVPCSSLHKLVSRLSNVSFLLRKRARTSLPLGSNPRSNLPTLVYSSVPRLLAAVLRSRPAQQKRRWKFHASVSQAVIPQYKIGCGRLCLGG
nr:hypothetical protein CFP56_02633 [Quercus suber]